MTVYMCVYRDRMKRAGYKTTCAERSQAQKATFRVTPFRGAIQNRQILRDRKEIGSCQGVGTGQSRQ